ncbi:G-protein-signaling modulator 1 [Lutra lutra]|uniref:G-protein-signaling modulator 1 n=1 Tax=Lutra lutra TaxID=9657 RepID=UPI001FD5A306|nr:G-protein-signaling modulator 1 [Lutra lutra]
MGEAKASGNLGNTLKVLGRFDEAVVCCQRHLDIAQEQGDKVGEARALYNIGNVYHAKGKQLSWTAAQDPGHLPPDVREPLRRASEFYERNLSLVKELGDRAAQGRAYGNLGNTHYLLGSFMEATAFHKERLAIAKEFGDKAAERRAYSNLGNAHIFLGRFDVAAEYYKKTLQLSRQLKDQAVEAQACYSLGNTYTLLQDYDARGRVPPPAPAHRPGAGRQSGRGPGVLEFGECLRVHGEPRTGLDFCQETPGDLPGGWGPQRGAHGPHERGAAPAAAGPDAQSCGHREARPGWLRGPRCQAQEDTEAERRDLGLLRLPLERSIPRAPSSDEECFFDLLSKFQSSRMDDQRCPLEEGQPGASEATAAPTPEERVAQPSLTASPQTEELLDLIASSQSRRLDDQRASVGSLPGAARHPQQPGPPARDGDPQEPGDDFFNMLVSARAEESTALGESGNPPKWPLQRTPEPLAHTPAHASSRNPLPALLLQALHRSPRASSVPPQTPGLTGRPGELRTLGWGAAAPNPAPAAPEGIPVGGSWVQYGKASQQPCSPACSPMPGGDSVLLSGCLGRGSSFLGPGLPALPVGPILPVNAERATGRTPAWALSPRTKDRWAHARGWALRGGGGPSCQPTSLCLPSPPGSMTSAAHLLTCCPRGPTMPDEGLLQPHPEGAGQADGRAAGGSCRDPEQEGVGAPSPGSRASPGQLRPCSHGQAGPAQLWALGPGGSLSPVMPTAPREAHSSRGHG